MPDTVYNVAYIGLILCCAMCFYRINRGPTAPDRAIGIDILGIVVVCFTALLSLHTGKDYYINLGIAWSILSFIGTMALAKHLEGKGFDE